MFLARSIRHKLIVGLSLVLVMLVTLSASGLSGLWSYRQAVRDLKFSVHEAPHKERLEAALAALAVPLLDPTAPQASISASELVARHRRADVAVKEFRDRLERLPPSRIAMINRPLSRQLLGQLQRDVDVVGAGLAAGSALDEPTRRRLGRQAAGCLRTARTLPDPRAELTGKLQQADRDLASRSRWLLGATIAAVLLFAGFVHAGYRWIFQPVRALHEGARRVAHGDLDYRVELDTRDEMAELAESFNQMTGRFQEIKADLDDQVRDRSRQLVRSERLAGVGFLAAGVAHEINNPLSAIAMASESLQQRLEHLLENAPSDERAVIRQYLQMIEREAFRCQEITARLLDFSRGQDADRSEHDLVALVDEVLALVRHMSRFRDRRIQFADSGPCLLDVSGPQIKQVILNLVANALESTEEGGRLEIELLPQTDQVTLVFTDDGCGMTEETIENLFEPFYTTKSTGRGTGLGLSISHRIVTEHGGMIEVQSRGPGHGSRFRLQLPRRCDQRDAA